VRALAAEDDPAETPGLVNPIIENIEDINSRSQTRFSVAKDWLARISNLNNLFNKNHIGNINPLLSLMAYVFQQPNKLRFSLGLFLV